MGGGARASAQLAPYSQPPIVERLSAPACPCACGAVSSHRKPLAPRAHPCSRSHPAPSDGTHTWEQLNLDDVDIRLKFAGMFHRGKRTPQRFMMRLKVGGRPSSPQGRLHRNAKGRGARCGSRHTTPQRCRLPPSPTAPPPQLPNGEVTSDQLRYLAEVLTPYGADGCGDITTRANLQLRGVRLEDADRIVAGLIERNMSSIQVSAWTAPSPCARAHARARAHGAGPGLCLHGCFWVLHARPAAA